MGTALEQLRYIDEQLRSSALTPEQAEIVNVHRLMGMQLRTQRLEELPPAPLRGTEEYEEWDRCRKDVECEVDLNLAESRSQVEGLQDFWERWLHHEKLKAIQKELLEQVEADPNFSSEEDSRTKDERQDNTSTSLAEAPENQEVAWQNMQDSNIPVDQHWDVHQQQMHQMQLQDMYRNMPIEQVQLHVQQQQEWQQLQQQQQQQQQQFQEPIASATEPAALVNIQLKLCRRCNSHKPVTEFYRSKANADGYDGRCKACDAVQCAQRRRRKERVENPTVEWKPCRRCGINKPASEFYRNKTNGDGLYNNCKMCFSHDAASRRERLPPLEERTASVKRCRRCKETKSASEFYKNKHMSDGLYTHCKACYTEAANLRSAGRAPAEAKRCRRCGHTKEASDFYISKMTADGLQSYCKACYAVASAARRTKSQGDPIMKRDNNDYNVQMIQDQLLQNQLVDQLHQHVLGVPNMTITAEQLQQLGYTPSLLQELESSHLLSSAAHPLLQQQVHHLLDHQALEQAGMQPGDQPPNVGQHVLGHLVLNPLSLESVSQHSGNGFGGNLMESSENHSLNHLHMHQSHQQ